MEGLVLALFVCTESKINDARAAMGRISAKAASRSCFWIYKSLRKKQTKERLLKLLHNWHAGWAKWAVTQYQDCAFSAKDLLNDTSSIQGGVETSRSTFFFSPSPSIRKPLAFPFVFSLLKGVKTWVNCLFACVLRFPFKRASDKSSSPLPSSCFVLLPTTLKINHPV